MVDIRHILTGDSIKSKRSSPKTADPTAKQIPKEFLKKVKRESS